MNKEVYDELPRDNSVTIAPLAVLISNGSTMKFQMSPVACYSDMNRFHVQTLWKFLGENQRIMEAFQNLTQVCGEELTKLGDEWEKKKVEVGEGAKLSAPTTTKPVV